MVGALAGSLHGASGIPALWLQALATETPAPEALCVLADRLGSLEPATFRDEAV